MESTVPCSERDEHSTQRRKPAGSQLSGGAESQACILTKFGAIKKYVLKPFPSVLTFGANIFSCEQFCTPKIFRGFAAHNILLN